jgi:hypothetical protein
MAISLLLGYQKIKMDKDTDAKAIPPASLTSSAVFSLPFASRFQNKFFSSSLTLTINKLARLSLASILKTVQF